MRPAATLRRASPPFCLRKFIQLPAYAGWQSFCADKTVGAEPCGALLRDCNAIRGLVSNGNEIGRIRDWELFRGFIFLLIRL